ncbi:MAG: hypothetical protein R3240_14375, partial [Gammaproteobacteria bacterium]|nr:hypothetical protein [Gammaproteobacteria bacterium]
KGVLQQAPDTNNVKILALGDPEVQTYINEQLDRESIVVQAEDVPMKDLKQDLHDSRRLYTIIWGLVYALWLVQ